MGVKSCLPPKNSPKRGILMPGVRSSIRRQAAALLALGLLAVGGQAVAEDPAREGVWILNNLPAAQHAARKTGKPIFVVFRCER
jgi:hypothetical protein